MKTLHQLVKEKNFYYVRGDITEKNFPEPVTGEQVEYDLVHFDKIISSEDAIEELSKDGWRPATVYDLLNWNEWDGKSCVVALGSVAEVIGYRRVPCLDECGSERYLDLDWFVGNWNARCRFLRVRPLSLKPLENQTLGHSNSFTLEKAIEICKSNGLTVTKTY